MTFTPGATDDSRWKYLRRAATQRQAEEDGDAPFSLKKFDPNAPKYRFGCGHVKQFLQVLAIVEMAFGTLLLISNIHQLRQGPHASTTVNRHNYHHVTAHDNLTEINDEADLQLLIYHNTTIEEQVEEKYVYVYRHNHEMLVTMTSWNILYLVCLGVTLHGLQSGRRFYLLPYLVIKCITTGILSFYMFVLVVLSVIFFLFFTRFIIVLAVLGGITSFSWYTLVATLRCMQYLRAQEKAVGGVGKQTNIVPVYIMTPGGPQVHFMGAGGGELGGAGIGNPPTVPMQDEAY